MQSAPADANLSNLQGILDSATNIVTDHQLCNLIAVDQDYPLAQELRCFCSRLACCVFLPHSSDSGLKYHILNFSLLCFAILNSRKEAQMRRILTLRFCWSFHSEHSPPLPRMQSPPRCRKIRWSTKNSMRPGCERPFCSQIKKGQPAFINLDKPYPNQIFAFLIWGSDRSKFEKPPKRSTLGKRFA